VERVSWKCIFRFGHWGNIVLQSLIKLSTKIIETFFFLRGNMSRVLFMGRSVGHIKAMQ